jgi:hypothetical protein
VVDTGSVRPLSQRRYRHLTAHFRKVWPIQVFPAPRRETSDARIRATNAAFGTVFESSLRLVIPIVSKSTAADHLEDSFLRGNGVLVNAMCNYEVESATSFVEHRIRLPIPGTNNGI